VSLEVKFVFHVHVVKLKTTVVCDDLADDARVGLPFLFFAGVPVVFPEVFVWRENWHLVHTQMAPQTLRGKNDPQMIVSGISVLLSTPQCFVLNTVGSHWQQTCERTLLKINQAGAVRRRTLWEDHQGTDFAFTCVALSFGKLVEHCGATFLITPLQE